MARKRHYTDAEILNEIRSGNQQILIYLFEENYSSIKKHILQNSGSVDDVDDVLQEAVIIVWQNSAKPEFQLSSALNTYIYAIVKNLWLKALKRKQRMVNIHDNEYDHLNPVSQGTSQYDRKVLLDCMSEVGETCKQLLSYYYFDGYNMTQIGDLLGFNNADTVKAKKYQCLKRLQDIIKGRFGKHDL
jgi:RNA polymerase sigma factor (sigma-70 family)